MKPSSTRPVLPDGEVALDEDGHGDEEQHDEDGATIPTPSQPLAMMIEEAWPSISGSRPGRWRCRSLGLLEKKKEEGVLKHTCGLMNWSEGIRRSVEWVVNVREGRLKCGGRQI